jgi:hypothetical protein
VCFFCACEFSFEVGNLRVVEGLDCLFFGVDYLEKCSCLVLF